MHTVATPFERCLDIPYYYLRTERQRELIDTLDRVERYRAAALAFWLLVNPPRRPANDQAAAHYEQEDALLRELRGVRFIQLLPNLPSHYRRFGYEVGEMLDKPPPEGTETPGEFGGLGYDPFDPRLALRELSATREALAEVHAAMAEAVPAYAAQRRDPCQDTGGLRALLAAHRRGGVVGAGEMSD